MNYRDPRRCYCDAPLVPGQDVCGGMECVNIVRLRDELIDVQTTLFDAQQREKKIFSILAEKQKHLHTSAPSYAKYFTRAALDIVKERERQEQLHPHGPLPHGADARYAVYASTHRTAYELAKEAGDLTWRHVLLEEVYEALASTSEDDLRTELIQVAAVALRWADQIDKG